MTKRSGNQIKHPPGCATESNFLSLSARFHQIAQSNFTKFDQANFLIVEFLQQKSCPFLVGKIIQDLINDCAQKEKIEGVYIRFDDLEKIATDIRAFKNALLMKVNNLGGISKLSELTGIPQPSLSRFFNSTSMPQRITLLKIAKALGLSQVDIATEWGR